MWVLLGRGQVGKRGIFIAAISKGPAGMIAPAQVKVGVANFHATILFLKTPSRHRNKT
jgi:hypothetical protein